MKRPNGKETASAKDRKNRGQGAITESARPQVDQVVRREVSRPTSSGGGKHRGDRRDMSKTYSGTQRHATRGNTPRPDVKTRKR